MKTYYLLLGLLLYCILLGYGQSQGVLLELQGQAYSNNSLVYVEEIGEHNSVQGALKCVNTDINCGTDLITESCNRTWNYPNGTSVPDFNSTQVDSLYVTRDNQTLLLNRPNGTIVPTGVYYCGLTDNNIIQQLYVGIYGMTGGTVSIDSLVYDMDPELQSIIIVCTSSGGPTSNVTWLRDGILLSSSSKYSLSQSILDTTSAMYQNKLTILNKTVSDSGSYECIVGNIRNSSTRSVTIEVCEEDSLRLLENANSLLVSAQICVQDVWQNIVLRDTPQTQGGGSNTLMLATPQVTARSLTIEWSNTEELNAGSMYELKCVSSSEEQTQSVTLTISDSLQTQVTFNGLLPNASYTCCVSIIRNTTGSAYTYIASTCGTVQTLPEAVLSVLEIAFIAVAAALLALLLLVTIVLGCALGVVLKSRNKRNKAIPTQGKKYMKKTAIELVENEEGGKDSVQLLTFKDKTTTDQTTKQDDTSPVFANSNATFDNEEETVELPNETPTSRQKDIPKVSSDQSVSKNDKATLTSQERDISARNTEVKARPAAKEKARLSTTPLTTQEKARDTAVKAKPPAKKEKTRMSTPQERVSISVVKLKPADKKEKTRVPTPEPDEMTPVSEPTYSEANVDPRATSEEAHNPLYGRTNVVVADEAENPMYGEVRRN